MLINIKTLSGYADSDPCLFDPDHFLLEYAKIRELKPGDKPTWNDLRNRFRTMIYDYAQYNQGIKLPAMNEIWKSQENLNLLHTVTYTMLKETCKFWCYKMSLKQNLNKLIQEQSLLLRFQDILKYINTHDCNGDENPCTVDHAKLVEVNEEYQCQCDDGYKWDPGKIRCIPYQDCSGISNSQEVYNGDHYECDCLVGYEWNADHTGCVLSQPDCQSYYAHSHAVFNQQTNKYECWCDDGYEWNADRTTCIQKVPDCPSYYAHSHAQLNPQTNVYECWCDQGYAWNTDRTACVPQVPDCPTYYAHSHAQLNPQTNVYECWCDQGYAWNTDRTACVPQVPDCPTYYAHSHAQLNPQTNVYECWCDQGYAWNTDRTACVSQLPDCNSYYPNTVASWNAATNQYECNCIQGYVWNATRTGCVSQLPDCNAYYPNTVAVWDAPTNQYLCNCIQGFEWNATRTGCVASTNRDNPPVNPAQQKTGECNVSYASGANEPEQYTIDVHAVRGTLDFMYNTYTVKDRIHVYYGNAKIFDSGCVGESGGKSFTLDGVNSVFRIIVDPQCEATQDDTQWDFTLGCPH